MEATKYHNHLETQQERETQVCNATKAKLRQIAQTIALSAGLILASPPATAQSTEQHKVKIEMKEKITTPDYIGQAQTKQQEFYPTETAYFAPIFQVTNNYPAFAKDIFNTNIQKAIQESEEMELLKTEKDKRTVVLMTLEFANNQQSFSQKVHTIDPDEGVDVRRYTAKEAIKWIWKDVDYAEKMATQKAEVATKEAEEARKKREVATQKAEVATQKAEVATQKAEVATKEAEEARKKREVATKEAEEARKKREVATKEAEEARKKREVATKEAEEARKKREVATKEAEEARKKREVATQKAEVATQKLDKVIGDTEQLLAQSDLQDVHTLSSLQDVIKGYITACNANKRKPSEIWQKFINEYNKIKK